MDRTERVTLTNMCMLQDGSRVLVQNRRDPGWSGITFPGGHVEKGESLTDAVIREVYEETGLRISAPRLCGVKDWTNDDGFRYIVLLYKADQYEGTLTGSDEGDVYWVELSAIDQQPLAESMSGLLQVFLNDDISEQFFYQANGTWVDVLK